MFIHPIYNNHQSYSQKSVNFKGGPNQEILKNQLKILLTQDIWAEKLKVKMPETPLEKDVLLEILKNRLNLDRFTRLTNEKFRLKALLSRFNSLSEKNPSHPDLPQLRQEIEKRGNLESVFKTLDKNIELERKKNQSAIDFFKDIEELEKEYLEKRLVKPSGMEKFWFKIKKQNINTDERYSTKELIDIVSNGTAQEVKNTAQVATQRLSKKQVLLQIEKEYEQMLREEIDVYEGRLNHNDDAQRLRKAIFSEKVLKLSKIYNFEKLVPKLFEKVEQKYTHKVDRLMGIDIYPIGEIWEDMLRVETNIKTLMNEIKSLKEQIAQKPNSNELKESLTKKLEEIKAEKEDWIKGLKYSVKYEKINRARMNNAGRLPEYDYLTCENKTIKKHKAIFEILKKNNDTIPEDSWTEIIK